MSRLLRDLKPENIISNATGVLTRKKSLSIADNRVSTMADQASPATKADIAAIMKILEDNEKQRKLDAQEIKEDISHLKGQYKLVDLKADNNSTEIAKLKQELEAMKKNMGQSGTQTTAAGILATAPPVVQTTQADNRMLNVVIHKLPPTNSDSECRATLNRLLQHLNTGYSVESAQIHVMKLGAAPTTANNSRPVKLSFKTYQERQSLFTHIKDLKLSDESINEWCKANNMAINIKKTKCMVFGRKNKTKKSQKVILNLDTNSVYQTKLYKYLGIILDENLTYNCHINSILKNANHKLYLLRRNRKYLTTETAVLLYKSHILPILEYGNSVFMSSNVKHLERLQFLQNSGLKSCFEASKLTSTNLVHIKANLNKLDDRRSIQLLKDMYKRTSIPEYIEKKKSGIVTRSMSSVKMKVPHFLNTQAQKSVLYRGSTAWNNLDKSIKDIKDKHTFNLRMKEILRNKLKNYIV